MKLKKKSVKFENFLFLFSETSESYKFLSKIHWTKSYNSPMIDQRYANYYIQNGDSNSNNEHISFLAGVRIIRDDRHPDKYSGYQVMRLVSGKKFRGIDNLVFNFLKSHIGY